MFDYRHSEDMITSLTKSGLGYHHSRHSENFGRIPMRHLVYRVKPLPKSLLHVVCDFGALDDQTEGLYINQIVRGKIVVSIPNMLNKFLCWHIKANLVLI